MEIIKREIRIPRGAKVGSKQEPIYGHETVPAYCSGGLAVHKSVTKGSRWKWMVSHERSGLSLAVIGGMTRQQAVENMKKALEIDFDWTLDENETISALRQNRHVIDAIREIAKRPD